MSTLFGVDIRALVGSAFSGQLQAATLHSPSRSIGAAGESLITWTDTAAEGVRTRWDERTRVARGYPMESVKIILIGATVSERVTAEHEITIESVRWRVIDAMEGPVGATYTVAAVLA